EQQLYYDERGAHDEDRFFRRGKFDRGPQLNREWFSEVLEVVRALTEFAPRGEVLEIAVGTGIWTKHLVASAERCVVLDSSKEALDMVKSRLSYFSGRMDYINADIFRWTPRGHYDVIFFGFWLTHVPPHLFEAFWKLLRVLLKPKGRVFFVDSCDQRAALVYYGNVDPQTHVQTREVRDGRSLRVYKVYYEPAQLQKTLKGFGWNATVTRTSKYFLYGSASPIEDEA
ncbi:MAG TPA: class I SAM-dependent methyltransferase, partial [Candidatus Acidoferrales bacterium]|nr:class I SAM-dependent methyltransferase [Candidatus Acidoferrales bacterium]